MVMMEGSLVEAVGVAMVAEHLESHTAIRLAPCYSSRCAPLRPLCGASQAVRGVTLGVGVGVAGA